MALQSLRSSIALCVLAGLVACSADKPKPTPLEAIKPEIAGRLVWSAKLGSVASVPMPSARNGVFTVASDDGTVLALAADTGRELWRASVGSRIAAGVGSDGRFSAVVTRDNELVVLDGGAVKWRTRLASRVVTAPLVAGERVFVMGVDRTVQAWDVLDGRYLWQLQRPGEALTLAQAGVLLAYKDTLLAGQGHRLAAIDPVRGTIRSEVALGNPRGTNEVERVVDLVGPAVRAGDVVCARAFQAAVGCADAQRGALLWSKPIGGAQAVGGDADLVVAGDGSDRITAWRTQSGDLAWTTEHLRYRSLAGFLLIGKTAVVGDFEGQVHFLDRHSGKTLLRQPTDGTPVVAAPVAMGSTILVTTRGGGVFAFRPE